VKKGSQLQATPALLPYAFSWMSLGGL